MLATQANGRTISRAVELNPTGMYSEVVMVTPEMAGKWLEATPKDWQRNISKKRLKDYCESRRKNRWVLHHQGIALDIDGVVRDGQHRLWMVLETGLPTLFYVTYNVPKEGFFHVDEMLPRSAKDAIRMAGKGDFSLSIIATANSFTTLPNAQRTILSRDEVIEVIKKHADALDFSEQYTGHGITRSVRALAARAYYYADKTRLSEWCRILIDGLPISANAREDSAAILFRNFCLKNLSSNNAMELEKYHRGQAAIQYFLRREELLLVRTTEKDIFPLPTNDMTSE